jgi:hypothetical protein
MQHGFVSLINALVWLALKLIEAMVRGQVYRVFNVIKARAKLEQQTLTSKVLGAFGWDSAT